MGFFFRRIPQDPFATGERVKGYFGIYLISTLGEANVESPLEFTEVIQNVSLRVCQETSFLHSPSPEGNKNIRVEAYEACLLAKKLFKNESN